MAPEEKTTAEAQTEALGGVESINDPGAGYPIVTGDPSADARMGTPLDPGGHERVASEVGRDVPIDEAIKADKPLYADDAEASAEVNSEAAPIEGNPKTIAADGSGEAAKAVSGDGTTDKAVRGPGATSSGKAKAAK